MKPNTMWIRNRCYRVINQIPSSSEIYVEDDLYPGKNHYIQLN